MQKDKKEAPEKDVKKFVKKSIKRTGFILSFAETALLAALLAGAVFLWYHPQVIYEKIKGFYPQPEKTAAAAEVKYVIPDSVVNSINHLKEQVNLLNNKTDHFMNIKADSSVVLSMTEKMNRLEKKAEAMAKLSNNGALLLSAALMVKESASQGLSFTYEAEILKTLSSSQPDLDSAVNYVYNNSSRQFASDKTLADKYRKIYNNIIAPQATSAEAENWKTRLLRKAKQYVKISEPRQNTEEADDSAKTLKEIENLVANGDLNLAVNQLSEPENRNLIETYPELNAWYQEARNKQKFYQSINKILAYSFSLMKAENLQNERQ